MIVKGLCDTQDWSNGAENSGKNVFFLNILRKKTFKK